MRNTSKITTLENKFPILSVENDCIISKDADITVAFKVELPEVYSVTTEEYTAIHSAWVKAIKVLPNYSIVCKQDWFAEENYQAKSDKEDMSFLSKSYERHFNERPFLNHTCYLFLTKTTKERARQQSNYSALTRYSPSVSSSIGGITILNVVTILPEYMPLPCKLRVAVPGCLLFVQMAT